jgi:DNA repair exonuclease SbcCD nuclease subunit
VNVLLAHVALTSLPAATYPDINELEIEEAAFDKRFDLVLLGHYHAFQKASKRTWYAGSTDTFTFADSPQTPKGVVVLDTEAGAVEHVENPSTRPLATVSVPAAGLSAGPLVDAVERLSKGTPEGGIVRVYLNEVDPTAYRQVASEQFQEAVPGALYVQIQPEEGTGSMAVQGGPTIGSLEQEWGAYVEIQDLAGLDRSRIVALGTGFLEQARGETV